MPVQYVVRAQVVDLQADAPRAGDAFFVDTNAWLWTCHAKATLGMTYNRRQQTMGYAGYLKCCARAGAALHWCGLGLSELAHNIERTEYKVWKGAGTGTRMRRSSATTTPPSAFAWCRKSRAHGGQSMRSAPCSRPRSSWITPPPRTPWRNTNLSPWTATISFFLQAARASGVTQIGSDDGDFCGVPGITLFTGNRSVLTAAQVQGKLLVR